ncbi:N-acetylphosphatidylethanolamine-hydrolyzing phospholipase D [Malassezia cuniculi]|uniref:N-acetylphosphatidylethanolamine-hydrolyzing phospholipase D n=1 Tax=Malassezia cuniculi TaxID=948313 RepID=A0AAF0J5N5_9BASI|nr:N-acetylphosphatidylethanolamine-hydrolyzing phospholipase D [Malassezia cuniculi]
MPAAFVVSRCETAKRAHHTQSGFQNPWPSWTPPSVAALRQHIYWGPRQATEPEKPLEVVAPDFSYAGERARATWIGHAGVCLQLRSPPDTFSIVFDPIFSHRCSPNQWFGPARSFPPPCDVRSLPQVDVVAISHNHYDHMDASTIELIATAHPAARFCVPLGCMSLLMSFGVPSERIIELDWWDHVDIDAPNASVRLVCTPAQHASGRGGDLCRSLWSSWTVEHTLPTGTFRVFFGGDTGLCSGDEEGSPECPAFAEVRERIGAPDLALLPVSVGATYGYIKSFDPLPDWLSPLPRAGEGLARAVHMTPRDAVRTMSILGAPVALAIHWGTFVEDKVEVAQTMARLASACADANVQLVRSWDGSANGPTFALLDHGASLTIG